MNLNKLSYNDLVTVSENVNIDKNDLKTLLENINKLIYDKKYTLVPQDEIAYMTGYKACAAVVNSFSIGHVTFNPDSPNDINKAYYDGMILGIDQIKDCVDRSLIYMTK